MLRGSVHPDFRPVAHALERQLARTPGGGAAVCVYHRGEKVVDVWGGRRDSSGAAWEEDTMSVSFSTTKGVTATALHLLADRGLLDYDDPVSRFWPEFAQAGKEHITIRHLLSHRAGLYGIRGMVDHARRMLDWQYMTDALQRAEPAHPPGAAHGYHGLTFGWLIGEIVQRVAGQPFSDFVRAEIAATLELDGFYVGAPSDQLHRAAEVVLPVERLRRLTAMPARAVLLQRIFSSLGVPLDLARIVGALAPTGVEDFEWSSRETLSAAIPAANGLFTARSLAKMYAALIGADGSGKPFLSAETLRRATEVQARSIDLVVPFPMHWRLGYHRASTTRGTPRRAFGHYGFGGSGAWADPSRQLAVALVLNSGVGTPFGDLRTFLISGTALRCATRRAPR